MMLHAEKKVVGAGGFRRIFRTLAYRNYRLFIVVFGLMVQMAPTNTILQTIVDDDKGGRVIGFYVMGVMGTTTIGRLPAGALSARLGPPETLVIGGGCCLAGALLFTLKLRAIREIIRPIYIEKGIITEVALGLQAAARWPKPPAG